MFKQKFYFLEEGKFNQYPLNSSINDIIIVKSVLKNIKCFYKKLSNLNNNQL